MVCYVIFLLLQPRQLDSCLLVTRKLVERFANVHPFHALIPRNSEAIFLDLRWWKVPVIFSRHQCVIQGGFFASNKKVGKEKKYKKLLCFT